MAVTVTLPVITEGLDAPDPDVYPSGADVKVDENCLTVISVTRRTLAVYADGAWTRATITT